MDWINLNIKLVIVQEARRLGHDVPSLHDTSVICNLSNLFGLVSKVRLPEASRKLQHYNI